MGNTLLFKTFCIEHYKKAHSLSGKETIRLFTEYNVLNYLDSCFDVLHTTGSQYMVEEIDALIQERK